MTNQPAPQLWDDSLSIFTAPIVTRPVLEDVSIIIPTLGRDILEQSLYWILKGSAWPGCLIIVNQGDYDKVDEWLKYLSSLGLNIKHIKSQERGRSAGVNRGIEQVETPFFAVTDDDCFVDGDWLKNMTQKLSQSSQSIVTGRVEGAGDEVLLVVTSLIPKEYRKPRLKFDSMSGGNMGTSISVVRQVGLFDEDPCMKTAEDAEWSYRSLKNKIKIIYDPSVCIWHFGWRDTAKRSDQYRHYAISHGGFYGKYLRKGDVFILIRAVLHWVRAVRRWIYGVWSKKPDLALIGRAYTIYLLPGIIGGLRSKAKPGRLD